MRILNFALAAVLFLGACGGSNLNPLSEAEILALLGARGRSGLSEAQIDTYARTFGFLDADGDGLITVAEYEENSIFTNAGSARGVFAATDRDGSGFVDVDEYVENRIITDEAKAIFEGLDGDGDGGVTIDELRTANKIPERDIEDVFGRFDTHDDGVLLQIEWLITWGDWARLPGVGLG
jgi:Ca2+-binding EF-hand superfamily protein